MKSDGEEEKTKRKTDALDEPEKNLNEREGNTGARTRSGNVLDSPVVIVTQNAESEPADGVEIVPGSSRTLEAAEGRGRELQLNVDALPVGNGGSSSRLLLPPSSLPAESTSQPHGVPTTGPPFMGALDHSNTPSFPAPNPFRLFTPESYQRLLVKEAVELKKAQERKNRPAEGRLVDGELKFDEEEDENFCLDRDPLLVEGNNLPDHLDAIFPLDYYNKPIEEVDQFIKAKVSVFLC